MRWVLIGGPTLVGRQAAMEACEGTLLEWADIETNFSKFRTIVGTDTVVVDVIGEYFAADQARSVVASCDIFDFADEMIRSLTSDTTELAEES